MSSCVPENKYDLAAVARAWKIGHPAINGVLSELLEWVKDANWPVAPEVANLLSQSGPEIVPHIRHVLASDDPIWKFWVIDLVVRNLKPPLRLALQEDLLALAETASEEGRLEDVDKVAREVLAL